MRARHRAARERRRMLDQSRRRFTHWAAIATSCGPSATSRPTPRGARRRSGRDRDRTRRRDTHGRCAWRTPREPADPHVPSPPERTPRAPSGGTFRGPARSTRPSTAAHRPLRSSPTVATTARPDHRSTRHESSSAGSHQRRSIPRLRPSYAATSGPRSPTNAQTRRRAVRKRRNHRYAARRCRWDRRRKASASVAEHDSTSSPSRRGWVRRPTIRGGSVGAPKAIAPAGGHHTGAGVRRPGGVPRRRRAAGAVAPGTDRRVGELRIPQRRRLFRRERAAPSSERRRAASREAAPRPPRRTGPGGPRRPARVRCR